VSPQSNAKRDLDEFHEDLTYQRTFWSVERIAWGVFALIIVAALLGLTGSGGPLAHAKAETPIGSVEYPRISRWQATDDLIVRLRPTPQTQGAIELDRRFVEVFEVVSIQPQPAQAYATPEAMRYVFDIDGGGEIVFQLCALHPAILQNAAIRIGAAEIRASAIILP